MANCNFNLDIIHFDVRDPSITVAYAYLTTVSGDCPHFVAGWHRQEFPAYTTTREIFDGMVKEMSYLSWPPSKAPELPE